MKNYKICVCGNKEIKITENTHVEIRYANENDLKSYEISNWFHTEKCPLDRAFWEELFKFWILNEDGSYAAAWLRERFIYGSADSLKFNFKDNMIAFTYYSNYTVYETKEWTELGEKRQSRVAKDKRTLCSIKCFYPMECYDMLNLLFKYINKEHNRKTAFTRNPIPVSQGTKKIEAFLDKNKEYISQFKLYVENTKKALSEDDTYKKFCKYQKAHENLLANIFNTVVDYSVLDINGTTFLEEFCGFDIYNKKEEILMLQSELKEIRIKEEEEREKTRQAEKKKRAAEEAEREKARQAELAEREIARQAEEAEREKARKAEEERLQKEAEVAQKVQNSNDPGEKEVEYALKWFLAETDFKVVPIKKICESNYRYNCIMLKKPDFIDEPQEYDHILVSEAGVFIIETKHWKGRVEIRPDGKWVRDKNNDGHIEGVASPITQMKRHEALIKKNTSRHTDIQPALFFKL